MKLNAFHVYVNTIPTETITPNKKDVYCSFLIWNFLIDKVGSLDIHNNADATTSIATKYGFLKISKPKALYKMIGNKAKIAPAGAGTPVKNLPDSGVFIFSIS